MQYSHTPTAAWLCHLSLSLHHCSPGLPSAPLPPSSPISSHRASLKIVGDLLDFASCVCVSAAVACLTSFTPVAPVTDTAVVMVVMVVSNSFHTSPPPTIPANCSSPIGPDHPATKVSYVKCWQTPHLICHQQTFFGYIISSFISISSF